MGDAVAKGEERADLRVERLVRAAKADPGNGAKDLIKKRDRSDGEIAGVTQEHVEKSRNSTSVGCASESFLDSNLARDRCQPRSA